MGNANQESSVQQESRVQTCTHSEVRFIEWGEEIRPGQYREALGECEACGADMVRGGTPDGFDKDTGRLEWTLDPHSKWEAA